MCFSNTSLLATCRSNVKYSLLFIDFSTSYFRRLLHVAQTRVATTVIFTLIIYNFKALALPPSLLYTKRAACALKNPNLIHRKFKE